MSRRCCRRLPLLYHEIFFVSGFAVQWLTSIRRRRNSLHFADNFLFWRLFFFWCKRAAGWKAISTQPLRSSEPNIAFLVIIEIRMKFVIFASDRGDYGLGDLYLSARQQYTLTHIYNLYTLTYIYIYIYI